MYAHHNATQQLWMWMHWNAGKQKCTSTKPDVNWLKDAMGKSKGCADVIPSHLNEQPNKQTLG